MEKKDILEKYEEYMHITKEIFAEKNPKTRMESGIQVAAQLKHLKYEAGKYVGTMAKKGKNVEDIEKLIPQIDAKIRQTFAKACNLQV